MFGIATLRPHGVARYAPCLKHARLPASTTVGKCARRFVVIRRVTGDGKDSSSNRHREQKQERHHRPLAVRRIYARGQHERDSDAVATNPTDEQFYDYFLKEFKAVTTKYNLEPAAWRNFIQLKQDLPPALQQDPVSVLDSGTRDLDLVRQCLERFVALTCMEFPGKEEQREKYRQLKPGSRALLWLLNDDGFHKFDLIRHPEFLRVVVHCVVADGGEQFLRHWLSIDETPSFATSRTPQEQVRWKGDVLRFLIHSTMYWSGQQAAFEQFEHAVAMTATTAISEQSCIPLLPAGIVLRKAILGPTSKQDFTQPVFRRFVESCAMWINDQDELHFLRGRLLLHDPVAPQPLEALRFFQRCDSKPPSPFVRDLFEPRGRLASTATFYTITRTAQVLDQGGYLTEAKWLLDFGRRRLPNCFAWRGVDLAV
ncbi:uncharacterized protein RCC_00075 [Ramularia collo-cygni]|uniref:Uncharacterized protein n=1 Tax=Ramularia collo-cygni TaxID=112498 RepID=A0A2D3UQ00_9PEZI|nr:uncharacterized protein RCC_00075 [Ramularia collo-cygni]CZT14100.1 uncharacterized protein RCC_00075 [Ramularia collo-cygni]